MLDTPSNLLDDVRGIRALVKEVETALRSQHQILQMRGMSLPAGTFNTLSELESDLTTIETALVNEATELSQLRALAGTSEQINSSLDLDEVLREAIQNVVDLSGAERGYIVLANPFSDEWEFRIAHDPEQQDKQGVVTFQGSRSILRKVLESGEGLLTDNAFDDERFSDNNATIARLALRSVVCVPLKLKDRVIGAVYVDNRLRTGVFHERERNLLEAFANQASITIENARLFTRVQTNLNAITELKEFMNNIFESIGSGVITTDSQHNITIYNRAAAQILDTDHESAVGQPLANMLPGFEQQFANELLTVYEKHESCAVSMELDDAERGRRALSVKISPLKDAGAQAPHGLALVIDDLTEQRESEAILSTLRRYLPPEMVDNITTIANLELGGERREVTCIFVEVRPLSSFPTGLRAQQIMELLNMHLTVASDCIHDAQGVIDKYMGHEVMGLFNSQLSPCADHAARAVQAALAMREAFLRLYKQLGIQPDPHHYRIGIHTGVATLGNVGSLNRRDFTAIGDTINLAKRLEENAASGQIIISEDTLAHMRQHNAPGFLQGVRCEEREAIQVKGRQQKTRIYEVFTS